MANKLNAHALSIAYMHFFSLCWWEYFLWFWIIKTAIFLDRQKKGKKIHIVMLQLINTED